MGLIRYAKKKQTAHFSTPNAVRCIYLKHSGFYDPRETQIQSDYWLYAKTLKIGAGHHYCALTGSNWHIKGRLVNLLGLVSVFRFTILIHGREHFKLDLAHAFKLTAFTFREQQKTRRRDYFHVDFCTL